MSISVTGDSDNVVVRHAGFFGSHAMTIPMGLSEFQAAYAAWKNGALIQDAFPTLSSTMREFIITGMPPDIQEEVFNEKY